MSRISGTVPIQTTGVAGSGGLEDLDMGEFLDLMIAELQNQDPLNPTDNAELLRQIGQIREIGATDQLTSTLNAVLLGQNMTTASSLIGKQITALDSSGDNIEGVVDRVSVVIDENDSSRSLRVHIGDNDIALNNIREIVGE